MKLNIENYKNISNLNLDVLDNKVNFIFGISGSGKTSIGQSLCKNIEEEDVMIGKNISDVKVKINDNDINIENVSLYNEDIIASLIVNTEMNSDIYSIIFSNDDDILKKKKEFQNMVKELSNFKDIMYQYMGKIDVLIKNYGGKLTLKQELPASSKIIKFEKAISDGNNSQYVDIIRNNESNYLRWINEGNNFAVFNKFNICPFCNQNVPLERTKLIRELCELTPKDFDVIFDNTNILQELKIKIPNYSNIKELSAFKGEIIDKIKLKDEINSIINIIDYYLIDNYNPSNISSIIVSNSFKKEFPEITQSINNINKKITEIKIILGELKHATDRTIHDNLKVLNDYIEKFGIPYKFKVNKYDINDKKADYILYHIKDDLQIHRTNGLSYGEKNIISLLLFLISNKNEIVIIDDPASSYDDYRRKIIFDLLYDLQNQKTLIILSHDMVFVKYAVFNRNQGKKSKSKRFKNFFEKTGRIVSFENYNNHTLIKDIEYDDFDIIENQVNNHIINNKLSYFRKIINLRILTENKKSIDCDYEIIYQYLSAILHRTDKSAIIEELNEKGFTEDDIINKINDKLNFNLEKIPNDILKDFDISELTNFEKIFYFRDEIQDESIRDEFNNIIHMNSSYTISLNPYKFDYFSPYIYEKINK